MGSCYFIIEYKKRKSHWYYSKHKHTQMITFIKIHSSFAKANAQELNVQKIQWQVIHNLIDRIRNQVASSNQIPLMTTDFVQAGASKIWSHWWYQCVDLCVLSSRYEHYIKYHRNLLCRKYMPPKPLHIQMPYKHPGLWYQGSLLPTGIR